MSRACEKTSMARTPSPRKAARPAKAPISLINSTGAGCERLLVVDDRRRVPTGGGDHLDHALRKVSLVAGQHQVLERVERRLHPIGIERRLAHGALDPFRRRRLSALG